LKPLGVRTVIIGVALVVGIVVGSVGFGPAIANTLTKQDLAPAPHYPTNENGQTYGSALYATSPDTEPDLIKAIGVDGTIGYVRSFDLNGPMPKTTEEALAMQRKAESIREIKLYDVDGKTVIGKFKIQNGKTEIFTDPPNN
ncbi:MAG: hypothetical protein ACYC38_12970, partial [Eubacteriales bacterium]